MAPKAPQGFRTPPKTAAVVGAAMLTFLLAGAAAGVAATRSKAEEALSAVTGREDAARIARVQITKARDALDRSDKARRAGDAPHADLLDELALEWAATAVDLARAAELEARAARAEKETVELEAQAKRSLTLIEQTFARRGKAAEQLKALGVELAPGELLAPPQQSTTGEVER